MTSDDIYKAVNDAKEEDRDRVAEEMLAKYDGEDKEQLETWIPEMIAALSTAIIIVRD